MSLFWYLFSRNNNKSFSGIMSTNQQNCGELKWSRNYRKEGDTSFQYHENTLLICITNRARVYSGKQSRRVWNIRPHVEFKGHATLGSFHWSFASPMLQIWHPHAWVFWPPNDLPLKLETKVSLTNRNLILFKMTETNKFKAANDS